MTTQRLLAATRRLGGISPDRPWLLPALAASVVFLLASLVSDGGLATSVARGDVAHYQTFAARWREGLFPYQHGFYVEYPPFALPVFFFPDYVSHSHYLLAFKWQMAICGLVLIFVLARALDELSFGRARIAALLSVVALAPLLQGSTVLNRYDLWPAMLVAVAVLLFLRDRERGGSVFLALAFAAKVYALALVPVIAIWIVKRHGRPRAYRAAAAFAATVVVVFGPFVVRSLHGLAYSYYTQARRGLQIESTGASVLLVADKLGIYSSHWVYGLSTDLAGRLPDVVGALTTTVQVGLVLLVAWLYLRTWRDDGESLATACVATISCFVAFGKVLSPQYVTWIVAIAPLARRTISIRLSALTVAVMLATHAELHWGDWGIRRGNWSVWVLLARNVALVALAWTVVRAVGPLRPTVAPEPSALQPDAAEADLA